MLPSLLTLDPARLSFLIGKVDEELHQLGHAHTLLTKSAGKAELSYALSGRLYLSKSGWLLLDVPAALLRGAFDALHEPGVELPKNDEGRFVPHVSVMTKAEVDKIGPENISERGHQFHYSLGAVKCVEPSGWPEMSKVWFVEIQSPEIRKLRVSYGLTPLPYGDHPLHATFGVRKRGVLRHNDVSKTSE